MGYTFRNYKLLSDFEKVNQFLRRNFTKYGLNGNAPQPSWEYTHTHPGFNHHLAHRFGIWEENSEIIGIASYEMDLGECFLWTKIGKEALKKEMLEYAEKKLFSISEIEKKLDVLIFDYEKKLRNLLLQKKYEMKNSEPITVYDYHKGFNEIKLPEGFSLISLEDENDIGKIHSVLWKGFNHGDNPDNDIDCRIQMQTGPNFRKDLTVVAKAPNGEYACFAGMWIDEVNHYAYLEPLATDPKYRKLGLASAVLTESMKRTAQFGAEYCFGGPVGFYEKIGFRVVCHREHWVKIWE